MDSDEIDLGEIVAHFDLPGRFLEGRPFGNGHINDTFLACFDPQTCNGHPSCYVLQRINHEVFRDPLRLSENVQRVTRHVRAKLEAEGCKEILRRVLVLLPGCDGSLCFQDAKGNYWRAVHLIERGRTYDTAEYPERAFEVARAFGCFQDQLRDLPGPRLHDTIPRFHDAEDRFALFEKAVARDEERRVTGARAEVEFALAQRDMVKVLADLVRRGEIPERITHNDTKINNVPLDEESGEALCVLDLDTVMPGLIHYDFGDMVRTMSCLAPEDETDLSRVRLEPELFDAVMRGYLAGAGRFLTPREIEYLAFSGKLMTFIIGLRFLTDHLQGDSYFRIHHPGHNLERCRMQFQLVRSIEEQEEALAERVSELWAEVCEP